jgi:hypothetical protein
MPGRFVIFVFRQGTREIKEEFECTAACNGPVRYMPPNLGTANRAILSSSLILSLDLCINRHCGFGHSSISNFRLSQRLSKFLLYRWAKHSTGRSSKGSNRSMVIGSTSNVWWLASASDSYKPKELLLADEVTDIRFVMSSLLHAFSQPIFALFGRSR